MKIGRLHIHWSRCRCCLNKELLDEAYRRIDELNIKLLSPVSLTEAHDREVLMKYMTDKVRDEFEALSFGCDNRWRPLPK